jgi:RNA polymerase sigma factor (sigma-70 family)
MATMATAFCKTKRNFSESSTLATESQLVAAAKRGEDRAFELLFQHHRDSLFWATYRIMKQREDAEDAVQDSMLRAFLHIREFDGRSKFGTWLTRIAINSALMILRKKRSALEVADENLIEQKSDATIPHFVEPTLNPEEAFSKIEAEQFLKNGIQKLRPSIRRALEIRELQEHSVKETASKMGLSVAATKARVFHAKRILRKSLRRVVSSRQRIHRIDRFHISGALIREHNNGFLCSRAAQ